MDKGADVTSVQFSRVTAGIADIDLSARGINSFASDDIPVNAIASCPAFVPKAQGFIANLLPARQSYGVSGAEAMDLEYDMTWQYLHAPVGTVLTFVSFQDMLDNISYIVQQILDNDMPDGSIDMKLNGIPVVGVIPDAANNQYFGAEFSLHILEYANG